MKATELTDEPLPVDSTSNIPLNSSMCLYLMYRTCRLPNQRLTSKWSITWSFRQAHRLSMASCVEWLDCSQEASGLKLRLTVCVLLVTEWLVLNVATLISIRTYEFRTANKTVPPLCISVCRNPTHPFAKPWGSTKPSLRNTLFALLHVLAYVKRPDWLGGPPSLLFSGYWCSYLRVQRPGREINDSSPSATEVKNEWSCASPLPICFLGVDG
jgi:hypothetical protein